MKTELRKLPRHLFSAALPAGFAGMWAVLFLGVVLVAAGLDQANVHREFDYLGVTSALVLLGVVLAFCRRPASSRLPLGSGGLLLLMLWGLTAVALVWSHIPYISAYEVVACALPLLIYAAWRVVMADSQAFFTPLGPALIGAGLVMAAVMIAQVVTGHKPAVLFLNPNSAAALVNLLWPGAAMLALALPQRAPWWQSSVLLGMVLVMVFAVGVDGSRAAFLAACVALGVIMLTGMIGLRVGRYRLLALFGVFSAALVAAYLANFFEFVGGRDLAGRMASLADPDAASNVRLLIWAKTWELIQDNPWLGIGPGVFWMAYAGVRPPDDTTAGFFVHNDYLQFWLERGILAPVLMLALGIACAYLYYRSLRAARSGELSSPALASTGAAFAAVAAAAVHGLFSYNFYLAVFLICLALHIAELERLAPVRSVVDLPLPNLRRGIVLLGAGGLLALAVTTLWLMAAAERLTEKGTAQLDAGEPRAAEETLNLARRRWDWPDAAWIYHADAYRLVLQNLSPEQQELRHELFSEAMRLLEQAEQRNPYRSQIYLVRAGLLRDNPELGKRDPRKQLHKALEVDPRNIQARLAYATWLRENQGAEAARQIIEEGLKHSYSRSPEELYAAAIAFRLETGDREGAERMRERLQQK